MLAVGFGDSMDSVAEVLPFLPEGGHGLFVDRCFFPQRFSRVRFFVLGKVSLRDAVVSQLLLMPPLIDHNIGASLVQHMLTATL